MSTLATNAITDAAGGNTATINSYTPTVSNMAGRNKIINGSMVFDQRNAGASVATSSGTNFYTVDRWRMFQSQVSKYTIQQNQGSVTTPTGFSNYLGITSSSAYTVGSGEVFTLQHFVEGFNIADLGWGTANAQPITISFWVQSSLTGTFGGSLLNNGNVRSYPFSYTISAANTWEKKTVTIAGDTSGTWLTNNGIGVNLNFSIGVGSSLSGSAGSWSSNAYFSATGATDVIGTSGATFYITGVQLEAGSVATPFEHRQYGQELQLCQRYYETSYPIGTAVGSVGNTMYWIAGADGAGSSGPNLFFKATKRATPTFTAYTNAGVADLWNYGRSGSTGTVAVNNSLVGTNGGLAYAVLGTSWAVIYLFGNWAAEAEL